LFLGALLDGTLQRDRGEQEQGVVDGITHRAALFRLRGYEQTVPS
jgi:hypothetical protein